MDSPLANAPFKQYAFTFQRAGTGTVTDDDGNTRPSPGETVTFTGLLKPASGREHLLQEAGGGDTLRLVADVELLKPRPTGLVAGTVVTLPDYAGVRYVGTVRRVQENDLPVVPFGDVLRIDFLPAPVPPPPPGGDEP